MEYINRKELELINEVRMLWIQHSEWTRMVFVSIIFKTPDKEAVIFRLLRNLADFAYFLRVFYEDNVAFRFSDLLTENLSLARNLVEYTMLGDTKLAEKTNEKLYKNADEISLLLSSINPNWHYESWRAMLYIYLDMVKNMAGEMLDGNYRESINIYDKFEREVMVMAEIMYNGILKQLPCKFCK
ncbi:hypothetical protein KQI41_01875 [Tissierella pigra]|uniref:hypothetical protein n=1 Tax=Tissierella pigra TaxID=2607614 RepID=UPI001C0F5FC1|nr:hypothetical protein [Tissierella pigra]MBU5425146.1 hypothetical protein [Tissierella pigra]